MTNLFQDYPKCKSIYGIFNDSFPPIMDGVTLTVENYAKYLLKKGKCPCVVTPWNPMSIQVPYAVMRFFSLPIHSRKPYRYGYPKLDPFIWRRLYNTDFKIIHSHCPFSSGRLGVYLKRKKNIPLIGTFHSKYRQDLQHSFRNAPWMVEIIMKRILDFFNECDEVWIPQAKVEETVREYGFKGSVTVVENGNDFANCVSGPLPVYKANAKRELNISEKEISLLFVGQHIWEKGLDVILEMLRILKQSSTPFNMHFIGTGYAADEIKQRAHEYGLDEHVHFHGVISNRSLLCKHYAAADLFIFPSFYDNAPLVVREAAALGTPTILLAGSTASEVISDRKNGFLADKNPSQFAALVSYLFTNPSLLANVSHGARSDLVRSWENVVDEVADRYETLISAKK